MAVSGRPIPGPQARTRKGVVLFEMPTGRLRLHGVSSGELAPVI